MLFTVNKIGSCRRIEHNGRQYLVVPTVAIRAGVLNNEFVPTEEIGRYEQAWNGIPVPLGHPTDRGVPVSANTPDIVARCPGRFWNARVEGDKLHGEIWLDIELVNGLGDNAIATLAKLESGEPVEVSTAYWRDVEDAPGELNGKPYYGIARNLRPDHLALLPNDVGACSWKDGCGAPRVNCGGCKVKVNILSSARRPTYDGTEKVAWADVPKTFTAFRDGYYKHTDTTKPDDVPGTVAGAPAEMKRWIAARSLLGDPTADNWRDLLFFPVVNPGTNKLNAGAVRAVLGGRAASADISEDALDSAQAMARRLLEDEFQPSENSAGGAMARKVTVNYEISLDERRSRVYDAWRAAHERDVNDKLPNLYVREVFDDKVIVEGDPRGLQMYPYAIDSDGQVVFGEPTRVQIVYEPVSEPAPAQESGLSKIEEMPAGLLKLLKPNREVAQVNEKDQLIEKLVANSKCPVSRDGLALLGMEDLKALEAKLEGGCSEDPPPAPPVVNQDNHQGAGAESAPAAAAQLPAEVTQLAEAIKAMGGVEAMLGAIKAVAANSINEHAALVAELRANERCAFGEDDLKVMPVEALRKLRDSLTPADFSGRGAPRSNDQKETVLAMPSWFAPASSQG